MDIEITLDYPPPLFIPLYGAEAWIASTRGANMNQLPTDPQERKDIPMATGLLDYFPDALAEVAHVSKVGNDQHNPGQPLHWAKHKSTDQADCIMRHLVERGTSDMDGQRHSAKVAWRALALLQMEIEAERLGMDVNQYVEHLQKQAAAVEEELAKMKERS